MTRAPVNASSAQQDQPCKGKYPSEKRLFSGWENLDPGGIRIARGIHFALATLLGAGLAYWAATDGAALAASRLDESLPAGFLWLHSAIEAPRRILLATMIGGVCAAHCILFTPPSSRVAEWRRFRILVPVQIGYFSLVALAAPGSWGMGQTPMLISWVFVIGGGLFLRRYGLIAGSIGTSLIILSLFGMILEPTRVDGIWLPLGAVLGCLAAAFVRFGAYRPSAVAAYDAERSRFHRLIADGLAEFARNLENGRPTEKHLPGPIRERWAAERKAMQTAALEDPPRAELFQRQTAADYRLILAAEAMSDSLSHLTAQPLPQEFPLGPIANAICKASARAAGIADFTPVADTAFPGELQSVRNAIFASEASRWTKLQALRALTSLVRLDRALDPHSAGPVHATQGISTAPGPAKKVAGRLALQGLVASGITVVLALWRRLDHAYWATLTVALVLAGTMGETFNRTVKRALGTAVGVLIAIPICLSIGGSPWLGLPLAILAISAIPVFLDTRYEIASGLIGFVVVLGLYLLEHLSVAGMMARIYETFIGAAVALMVAFLVVPIYSADNIGGKLRAFLASCRKHFEEIRSSAGKETNMTAPLEESLRELVKEAPALESERFLGRRGSNHTMDSIVLLEALVSFIGLFERARASYRHHSANAAREIEEALRTLDERIVAAFDYCAGKELDPPEFQDLIALFAKVAPLDGSMLPAQAFHIVEQLYYGRRIGEALKDIAEQLKSHE